MRRGSPADQPGRSGARLPAALLAAALVCASPTARAFADEAVAGRPDAPGESGAAATRISLTIWNDSTTGGINGIGMLWGARNLDGNDVGFTHGMTLSVERTDAGGLSSTATVSSKLYLRQIGESSLVEELEEVPVWCTEEDIVSLTLDTRRRRLPFYFRLGGGFLSLNKGANPLGSLRQQLEFHSIVHTSDLAHYNYYDDGWDALGFFVHAAAGIQRTWEPAGAVRITGSAELALEPNTLYEASQVLQRLEGTVAFPAGRVLLEALVGADTALHPEGVEYLPRIALSASLGRWSLASAVGYPRGELRNHARYNDDKDAIATLTLTLML